MENKDIDKLEKLLRLIDPDSEVFKKTKEEIEKMRKNSNNK